MGQFNVDPRPEAVYLQIVKAAVQKLDQDNVEVARGLLAELAAKLEAQLAKPKT